MIISQKHIYCTIDLKYYKKTTKTINLRMKKNVYIDTCDSNLVGYKK